MCGICGFIGGGHLEDLSRMIAPLTHRGPDDEGTWHDIDARVFLGHRRLSVIDPAGGRQPMSSGDGELVIIFNGEIYNHTELRQELSSLGHRFLTDHSDTEVLVYGYREWGGDLALKLNGMWAFAIYDRGRRRVYLSRDRFGKKPLFYTYQRGTFAFASELNALISHPGITSNISEKSLKKYFAYGYIPSPSSLYENIYKLPGGYDLTFDLNGHILRKRKYWDFELQPYDRLPPNPEERWGEQLRHLLDNAVKRRLEADVPLGIFLSGGIDSSSITALATNHIPRERLKTFSIGFEEESFDETGYSKNVASVFGTDHHREVLSIERARTLLPEIMAKLDEPMGDSSLLPTYLLCQATRKHVTVALGGDGGDELFAGYDPFKALRFARLYSKIIPRPVHRAISLLAGYFPVSHRNMSLDFKVKRSLRGLSYPSLFWNSVWLGPLEPKELDRLFQETTDLEEVYEEAIILWDQCTQKNLIDKTLQFYTKLYLQDDILVKADRASMMHSLEVRSPYLDVDLVDFVRKIPSNFKFRKGQTKYILKKALEPIVPKQVIYRPKKGFGAPIGKWFKNSLLAVDKGSSTRRFNGHFIDEVQSDHVASKHDHRAFLWNLWVLNAFTGN
jgi:asparagine synthase (glutamine-hydrolysing)